tara:strand:- start:460 stop:873 length:414 start_codon:yes stop_codon:yes gene_type:complete
MSFKMNSPFRKDQLVETSDGTQRVKPVKNLGDGVQSFTVKSPDKSTRTNRYRDGKFEDTNYNPSKMKTKKIRKKKPRIPNVLKNVEMPEYNVKVNVSDKDQAVYNYNKKNKNTKAKPGKKTITKTKNLVTGKINKTA